MKKLVFSAFAVGLCLSVSFRAQVPSYVPTNGLVGWWPFNGNANDESGNGNNGTVNGATLTTDRFGNIGKAYSFDGVDDFNVFGDIQSLNNSNAFSVSVFFNYNNPPSLPNDWYTVVADGSYADIDGWGILIKSDQILMRELDGFNGLILNYNFLINNWYHLTATCESDSIKLFINGQFIGGNLNLQSNLTLNTSNFFRVGNGTMNNVPPNSHPYYFSGKIDDLGLWNRALTNQEITDLYNANICYDYVTVTDTLVINTGITGYNPIIYLNTLKIWPNPTNDHITIDAGNLATMNGYSIKIEDAQGQQVFQNAVTQQQFYVDITTWGGNGLYFVRIIDPQGNTVDIKKIVLQ
jgi:hypothetical protein